MKHTPILAMLPSNGTQGSSASRTQVSHKIGYPDGWKTGPTHEWYKGQPCTTFKYMQYRKEREAPFYPEYIVTELDNGSICRFDRGGDASTRANAFTLEGITAWDTAHVIDTQGIDLLKDDPEHKITNDKSDLLLRIHFPKGEDLLTILGIYYCVQRDEDARGFTLTKYNCYFLSWTIITSTARRAVDWTLLENRIGQWEDLVKTTIESLGIESKSFCDFKAPKRSLLSLRRKGDATIRPNANTALFVNSWYLVTTLRQALVNTREDLQRSLGTQLFQAKVESCVRKIFESASKEAAQSYAFQAARDTAMQNVIESSWHSILSSENGGRLWEIQCKAAENSVWLAANAAACADLDADTEEEKPKGKDQSTKSWEVAWDKAWEDGWSSNSSNGSAQSDSTTHEFLKLDVSSRAKSAWKKAKTEAQEVNEAYTLQASNRVAEHVYKNLPESSPEALQIDTSTKSKLLAMLQSLGPEKANSELQTIIRTRIADHCQKMNTMGILTISDDIERVMTRIWALFTSLNTN